VIVLGPSTVGPGEVYPLTVPANVVVTTRGGAVDVGRSSPTTYEGFFWLASPKSGIEGGAGAPLTLRTPMNFGIQVRPGSDDTTFVRNLAIQGYQSTGIFVVPRARLSIGEGVVVTGGYEGVVVSGHADISVPAGHATTSFNATEFQRFGDGSFYGGRGIIVGGSITIHGVPGATSDTGTVVVNDNAGEGVYIDQQGTAAPQENLIDGLVAHGNGLSMYDGGYAFAGIHVGGGSHVKVRRSVLLGNGVGVEVATATTAGGPRLNGLDAIDLGVAALADGGSDYGHNVLQSASDGNKGSGICLAVDPGSGTLNAAGNVFSGPRDCAGSSPGNVVLWRGSCARGDLGMFELTDAGLAIAGDAGGFRGNGIDVSNCGIGP
jgi:hypothetical protein